MQSTLGRRLRLIRAERGLSLREAARQAGVVKETISAIERGKTHPYDVTLAKLAHTYGVPVEELLELEEPVTAGKAQAPQESGPSEEEERRSRAAWEAYGGGEAADHGEGPAEYISAPTSVVTVPRDLYDELLRAAEDHLDPETLQEARELASA
jgi:transcriptional regulator with XRE-family HTH domain